ncbi:MAG: PVC-type heme-binding CxxCH protein, partial [Fimbriiglobus sp.]
MPNPDPELERKSFQVADGFEVNLYAADPLLAKPIQMNFDPQGRLWVASSEIYPQIKPGEVANDKVLVLEDTNGDGTADKTTVFADGLLIPTGLAPGDGGVYVGDSTEIVHFSDPDPKTGKARKKRIVLSGFGTEDTHHIVHTFRWGPDGPLYFNQSIYIHSHVETPHGVRRLNGGGIWQFRPESNRLEVFARGWVNSWGHQWDKFGAAFATDGAGGQGINYIVPGGAYFTAEQAPRVVDGLNPGSPKFCGLEVISGRHFPDSWQGNLITNDFRGHRVCRYELKPDGSGFVSKELPEVIKTSHGAFRPIDVAMGPDGALYIADWYNPIIQHGEVDFRDPRRDKTHGRIWRVTAKGRPLVKAPKLVDATVPELLEQLKSPEQFTRLMAKRVLKVRLSAMSTDDKLRFDDPVFDWAKRLPVNDPSSDHARLEALWVSAANGEPDGRLLDQVLRCKTPDARAAACRLAGARGNTLAGLAADPALTPIGTFDLIARLTTDEHPRVRLEAVRAMAKMNSSAAAAAAAAALDKPLDKWLDYAIWLTLRELAPVWLPEFEAGTLDFGGKPNRVLFALKAAGSANVAKPLVNLWTAGKIDKKYAADVLPLIAEVGSPTDLTVAWTEVEAMTSAEQSNLAAAVMTALMKSARERNVRPAEGRERIAKLVGGSGSTLSSMAAPLAGAWKEPAAIPPLTAVAANTNAGPPQMLEATAALAAIGTPDAIDALKQLAGPKSPNPNARIFAVPALAGVDPVAAAPLAVESLKDGSGMVGRIVPAFVEKKGGAAALAKALAGATLRADDAKLAVRAAKAAAEPSQELVDALSQAGGLTAPKRD